MFGHRAFQETDGHKKTVNADGAISKILEVDSFRNLTIFGDLSTSHDSPIDIQENKIGIKYQFAHSNSLPEVTVFDSVHNMIEAANLQGRFEFQKAPDALNVDAFIRALIGLPSNRAALVA